MDKQSIRQHVEALDNRSTVESRDLTSGIVRTCWPGGAHDRTEPGALAWVRRWYPARIGATLSACSCAGGRCVICN